MALEAIELSNFRSYERQSFKFGQGLNLIIGPNGAGKTNLLEAIYTLANTRSWREPDRNLVMDSEAGYKLSGQVGNKTLHLEYTLSPAVKKQTLINKTKVGPQDYFGNIRTILFEPNSLNIIAGGPEARRQWCDQVLSVYSPDYLLTLLRYKRALKQRNALLKGRHGAARDQIFAWDVSLAQAAGKLIATRLSFIDFLNLKLQPTYKQLAGQKDRLTLEYQTRPSTLKTASEYSSRLLKQLSQSIDTDLRYGFTTVGPHRDDVEVVFKNHPASQVASRGESRTIVLAIKLVEYEWLKTVRMAPRPVLLFDDIFSELDEARRKQTLAHLKKSQIFITTTDIKGLSASLPKEQKTIKLG